VKVMHINMHILNTYTICGLSQINMFSRISIMIVEVAERFEGISEFLIVVSFIKTFAWVSIYNFITYITYAAFIFSSDYERNNRIWVSYLLILGNSLFSGMMAVLLMFDILNGVIYAFLVFCVSNVSCAAFMLIKAENVKENARLNNFDFRNSDYTVSQRWQVKDNVRLSMDSRLLVFGSALQISFYLPFFFLPPFFLGDKPEERATLELYKAIFHLISAYGFAIAELFVVIAFSRNRDYIRSMMGVPT
ncbi:hypothetical protein PENTCL1PPCAC_17056, partial [Pristionchus entomophagus]